MASGLAGIIKTAIAKDAKRRRGNSKWPIFRGRFKSDDTEQALEEGSPHGANVLSPTNNGAALERDTFCINFQLVTYSFQPR